MSKIDDLIAKYCPNGVEYKTIADICNAVFAGGTPNTSRNDFYGGDIPWLRSGEVNFNQIYKTEKTITQIGYDGSSAKWIKPQSVLLAMTGATVARSAVNEVRLTANQSVCAMEVKPELIYYKFLYYVMANKYEEIKGMAQGALTSINLSIVKKIVVPVPPLAVQEEIVNILDSFTLLEAELEAELEARKKQYEHYRDELLNPENMKGEKQWKKLEEVCEVYTGGEAPVDCVKGVEASGDCIYPVYGNGKEIYGYSSSYKINKDAVCISSIGANTGAVFYYKKCFTPIIRLKVLVPKNSDLNTRYLYYIATTINFVSKNGGGIPNMNANDIKKQIISVPPLAEQERIVSILDKFDALVNDISDGLPAEINARRQQYEYYRDKLLNFEPIAA